MAVINTNVKALYTQHALKGSARAQTVAMEQLSTGKRINSARDDAAGMAIAKRMSQQIRSLDMAIRNAGDAVALIQTAEGATGSITDMLQRMRELAIQAMNDTNAQDQRGYLDLEFQQLKQQIVTISEYTEWNGFPLLNGKIGEPVGERPVYKTVSSADFDTIFIDPTTTRSIAGAGAGEKQTLTLTLAADPLTAAGTLSVGGVNVSVAVGDNLAGVANKVVAALRSSDAYGANSGRTVSAAAGVITVQYAPTESEVADISFTTAAGVTAAVATPTKGIASTVETFTNAGKFLSSGTLSITVPSLASDGAVTAKFVDSLGVETTLTGTADIDAGLITFTANAGNNSKIISDTLTYTLRDPSGTASDLTSRAVSLTVDVAGSVAPLKTGDIVFVKRDTSGNVIERISIPESEARNDKLSPPNNAAGSAIAIAAAINSKTSDTGIAAVVNKNVMAGGPMSGASVVSGNLVINGFSTPKIESIYNNPRDTRAAVVEAINKISAQTGVVAINTGNDTEGVRLEAADGRNIEISYANLSGSANDFAARLGVRAGVQAGTYSLEARVETAIEIESIAGGDIGRARLTAGAYTQNISTLNSDPRAAVTAAANIKTLKDGDLVINGVAIPGTTNLDDKFSSTVSATSDRSASALAITTAINSQTALTGVTASTIGATTQGDTITRGTATGTQSLFINGIEVRVDFSVGTNTTDRINEIIKQVNLKVGEHGTQASKSPGGALQLTTVDGRNLSVWFNSVSASPAANTAVTASNFGLGVGASDVAAGVKGHSGATATYADAPTVYGRVALSSPNAFEIKPGSNGFSGNFTTLGFQQGTFGGQVDNATSKMTPPNVGRLSFHVGASSTQTIHIDFADYGAGGPITGEITGDVALSNTEARVNRIDSTEAARSVLAKLDSALDKVNGNRAVMGAVMNRLDYIMENLSNVSMNTSASRSQIEDADYAKASTELARTQIMQQAATAVLAQANMDQQTVLKLLQ
jgi:flagellin